MTVACRVCHTTSRTSAFLCKPCTAKLEGAIAELPADLIDLTMVASRQASGPLGLGQGREWVGPFEEDSLGDAPWVFAPGPSDQVWALRNTVMTWARHLMESRGIAGPERRTANQLLIRPARRWLAVRLNRPVWVEEDAVWADQAWPLTIADVCRWLLRNVDAIRYDEAAAEIHDELIGLHAENETWILGRSTVEVFAGNCDATQVGFEVDDQGVLVPVAAVCGVALYGREDEETVKCTGCGTKYDLPARLDEIRERGINDQLARAHHIADALTTLDEPLGPVLLRKWIQRDANRRPISEGPACVTCVHPSCRHLRRPPILARGFDDDGHPLYRFGDVRRRLQLVQEQRGAKLTA